MSDHRKSTDIEAELAELDASGAKSYRKKGTLRSKLIDSLKHELALAREELACGPVVAESVSEAAFSVGDSSGSSVADPSMWVNGVELAPVTCPDISTDAELVDRIVERFASTESRSSNLQMFWNRIRSGLRVRRTMCEAAGITIPGQEIELPTFSSLNIDPHSGEPIEAKPEPIPAPVVSFESEVERDARLVEESHDRDTQRALRGAQAIADSKRGQLTAPTAAKAEKRALEAELARAGAPAAMPKL